MRRSTTPSSATIEPAEVAVMTLQRATKSLPAPELLRVAAEAAASKKAIDVVGLDLSGLDGVADYFLICSGSSEPQVKAIAEAVEDRLREQGAKAWHVEGMEFRRWVLLDFVDVVVHVFHEKTREYYLLERLWGDARRVDLGVE
jgi:ribosome-associated protein